MLILSQLLPMPMMLWVSLVVGFVGWWVSGGGSLLGNDDAGNAAARQTGSSSSSSRHTSAATAQQEAAAAAGGGGDGSELSTSGVQQVSWAGGHVCVFSRVVCMCWVVERSGCGRCGTHAEPTTHSATPQNCRRGVHAQSVHIEVP
jgi:hypothetical protein